MTGETTTENPALPGARLRQQRERRGLTLSQAGIELHVNERLLAALEDDNYTTLGAPIFVKGHLRNYARLLGLDPVEVIAAYEAAQQPADPTLVAHRPDGPRMDAHRERPWVGWIGWIFLLLLGVLLSAWWYYQQEGGADFVLSNTSDRVRLPEIGSSGEEPAPDAASPEGRVMAPDASTTTAADTATFRADAPVATQDNTAPGDVPPATRAADAATGEAAPGGEAVEDAAQDARPVVQALPPPATRSSPAARPGGGLVLELSQESWVEIYDAEGRPILYDLLGAGTRREITASGELRLFLGNADGVQVYLGGERVDLERYRRNDSTARFSITVPARD